MKRSKSNYYKGEGENRLIKKRKKKITELSFSPVTRLRPENRIFQKAECYFKIYNFFILVLIKFLISLTLKEKNFYADSLA